MGCFELSEKHLSIINDDAACDLAAFIFHKKCRNNKSMVKELVLQLFQRVKKLELIYSALKYFKYEDPLSKEFHRIVLENEKSKLILKKVLKILPDKISERIAQEEALKFSENLQKAINTQSIQSIIDIRFKKKFSVVANVWASNMSKSGFPSFQILGDIIQYKIALAQKNFETGLENLQNAILRMPTSDVLIAIGMIENKISFDRERYVPRKIEILPPKYSDKLKATKLIRMLKKYEKNIFERTNLFDRAMIYIDLSMALGDPLLVANCFLLASAFLLKYSKERPVNEIYACSQLIKTLITQSYSIGLTHLDPFGQKYVYGIVLDFMNELENIKLNDDPIMETIAESIVHELKQIAQITVFQAKFMNCLDILYVHLIHMKFLTPQLRLKSESSKIHQFYLFDGLWKGWFIEEEEEEEKNDQFMTERLNCMKNLNNFPLDSVEQLMNWPLLKQKEGWMTGELNLSGKTFGNVDGFELNLKTGKLALFFSGIGLFNLDDLSEILGNGITGGFFTLDQPEYSFIQGENGFLMSNPYQQMIYAPQKLSRTDYLGTLLHADYLLKELTTGVEVNSKIPFAFRKFDHKFEFIEPLETKSSGHAHRFWIEPGPITYQQDIKEDVLTVWFSDVKMFIKNHRMKFDETGKLIDDTNEDPDSPEEKFAKNLTKNYDKLSQRFPVLGRLKPLLKLSAVSILLKSYFQSFEKHIKLDVPRIFSDLRNQVKTFPFSTYSNIENELDKLCKEQGLYDRSRISNLQAIREQIRQQFSDLDYQIVDNVYSNLMKVFDNEMHLTREIIHSWLSTGNYNSIKGKVSEYQDSMLKRFRENLHFADLSLDSEETLKSSKMNKEPNLVPSVFARNNRLRIYGGVNMSVNFQKGTVTVQFTDKRGNNWTKEWENGKLSHESYIAQNKNNNTQMYWKSYDQTTPIEHMTFHNSERAQKENRVCYNVHFWNGENYFMIRKDVLWEPKNMK